MRPTATIVLPDTIVATLARICGVLEVPPTLVGGWAVRCRLQMARAPARPTDDLDLVLSVDARPARAALESIDAVQRDPAHPCRLDGLPVLVDLLADDVPSGVANQPGRVDERITDVDGLNLLVPPFAALLTRTAAPVRLTTEAGDAEADILLPLAGAVLAAKVANVAMEFRTPEKRASDGEDVVRLLSAFGVLALVDDLTAADDLERRELHRHLAALGPGGISGQARAAGHLHDEGPIAAAIERLLERLS